MVFLQSIRSTTVLGDEVRYKVEGNVDLTVGGDLSSKCYGDKSIRSLPMVNGRAMTSTDEQMTSTDEK